MYVARILHPVEVIGLGKYKTTSVRWYKGVNYENCCSYSKGNK